MFIIACLSFPTFAFLQSTNNSTSEADTVQTIFQHLSVGEAIPKIRITTDVKKIIDNKFSLKPVSAVLDYTVGERNESWDIKLSVRGKSRRRICYMPPLKISFPKEALEKKGIRKKHRRLKLVSYCKNQNSYENYVLREYLAYKLYNILTDYSFRVQLVEIEYRDANGQVEPVTRHGFIIEDVDELADRFAAKEKDVFDLKRDSVNHFQHDIFALFQFMIGNTDWKLAALHNIKMIQCEESQEYFVIPYDFDYSGFVNSVYAIPNVDLRQVHVKDRIYMGACKDAKILDSVRQHFFDKKEEILAATKAFDLLSKRSRKNLEAYIKSFYKILESDKKFDKNCLKKGKIWY